MLNSMIEIGELSSPDLVIVREMMVAKKNCCVVVLDDQSEIELAVDRLEIAGCDLLKVSVIAKECETKEHPVGIYCSDGQIDFMGEQSLFWEGLRHRLTHAAFFSIHDVGTLMVAGQIIKKMVHGLTAVEVGDRFNLLAAALFVVGVPQGNIKEYEQAIKAEKFLLLFYGEQKEVEHVCNVLHCDTQQVTVHHA